MISGQEIVCIVQDTRFSSQGQEFQCCGTLYQSHGKQLDRECFSGTRNDECAELHAATGQVFYIGRLLYRC